MEHQLKTTVQAIQAVATVNQHKPVDSSEAIHSAVLRPTHMHLVMIATTASAARVWHIAAVTAIKVLTAINHHHPEQSETNMLKLYKVDTIIQDHRMVYPTEMGRAYVTVVNIFIQHTNSV